MNKEFIKRLTLAHGWIGLTFSGLLFIIFFAGSIALFRQEVGLWAIQPHLPVNTGEPASVEKVIESALAGRDFDNKEHFTLLLPTNDNPYYKAFVDIKGRTGEDHHDELLLDPITGEVVSEGHKFEFGEFMYKLHYDLNIPAGKYVLGFVTLFFLFIMISGIFIHAKKLISNFFQYRGEKHKRSQLLDIHTVVGTITFPFMLMYAISGLIFNLVIIYQVATVVTLYKGDQAALFKDAGILAIEPEWQDKPTERVNIDELIAKVSDEYQVAPRMLTIFNYGDESSVIRFRSLRTSELTTDYDSTYSLVDERVIIKSDSDNPNSLTLGTGVLRKLHYGNYSSVNLRILYLFLALSVCGLIVTGNFLWIEKREKLRNHGTRSITLARYITMLCSAGIIFATSIGFFNERFIPADWDNRVEILHQAFWISLAISAIIFALPKVRANYKKALSVCLYISAGVIYVTLAMSIALFAQPLIDLFNAGSYTTFAVDVALFISASLLTLIGVKLMKKSQKVIEPISEEVAEEAMNTAS